MSANMMPVTLLSFRPVVSGALRGFASIQIGALIINDVSVYRKDDKTWASLPAKPMIGKDGPILNNKGKQRYQPIAEWKSAESAERFSTAVCAAITEQHPQALA